MIPAPLMRAESEISVPARRKKNGVSKANAMVRIRSRMTLSFIKTPATTSPATYAGNTASLPAAVARPPRASKTTKMIFTSGSLTLWPTLATTQRMVREGRTGPAL